MPRAPKLCTAPGCTNMAQRGSRCDEHPRGHNWTRYPSANTLTLTREQRRAFRDAVLARDHTCQACHTRPATEADHIIPTAAGGPNNPHTNGQGLCHECHQAKTRADKQATSGGHPTPSPRVVPPRGDAANFPTARFRGVADMGDTSATAGRPASGPEAVAR